MIPRTFPSTYASNGQQQMVVYFLPSITGLRRWLDYIPVKLAQSGVENSYANNGYIDVTVVSRPTATQQAWKEYIPVYLDDAATDTWLVNAVGYIPYGYALFSGASMIMDMTNTGALDSRVTFSRTSNATQFDSTGALVYAPHNLLTFSESFDNAAWVKSNATVTANTTAAPNGSVTGDKLVENSTNSEHITYQSFTFSAISYTNSVYAKAGERTVLYVWIQSPTRTGAFFNLGNGTTSNVASGVVATIVDVGNGWYRCSITFTPSAGAGFAGYQLVSGVATVYAGDGTSGLFLWGTQLNVDALQPYYRTTVKNLLGYTQEFDNAAWTKTNSTITVNPRQLNLLSFPDAFDNAAWTKSNTTVTADATTAPDGGLTADKLVENTATNTHLVRVTPSLLANETYTFSVYAKAAERTVITLTPDADWVSSTIKTTYFNLSTGRMSAAPGQVFVPGASTIEPVGDGWYRCSITATTGNDIGISSNIRINLVSGTTLIAYTGNGTSGAFLWGARMTLGTAPGLEYYPAPDGSFTTDKLVETTANAVHQIDEVSSTSVSGTVYRYSIRIKSAERTRARIVLLFGGSNGVLADANLSAVTISAAAAFNTAVAGTSSIQHIGDGWYVCSVSGSSTSGGALQARVELLDASGNRSYTGDGTSGILIWGAQISDSASLDPYVYNPVAAPASAAYYGPRFDYDPATLEARGLLIEEQRTNGISNNTMQGAVAGSPGTLPTNWVTVGGGLGTLTQTIVGVGTSNGINYIDLRINGTTSTTSYGLGFDAFTQIAASAGQAWTSSVYVARVGGSTANFANIFQRLIDRDAVGLNLGSASVDFMPTLSTTLTRVPLTRTLAGVGTACVSNDILFAFTSGVAIDITLRIGLPQLELGAFATSVIPTTTAAATRTADVATMIGANFSNWYNASEGTFAATYEASPNTFTTYLVASNGVTAQNSFHFDNDSGNMRAVYYSGSSAVATLVLGAVGTVGTVNKVASAYRVNDFAASRNAGTVVTDTAGAVPVSLTQLNIGADPSGAAVNVTNTHIRRIAYFPTRLTNAQLQAITQ